jgi:hypothetical protein
MVFERWRCEMSRASLNCSKIVTWALVLALTCQASTAQKTLGDWTNVQDLPVDTTISVKTKAGAKYHGDLVRATADLVAIDSDEPASPGRITRRRELKREDIREIRLVAAATSTLAGAGIGAGVGAGIGVGLDSTARSHEYRGVLALVMALLGAAVGAAVAHRHPFIKGRRIYVAA